MSWITTNERVRGGNGVNTFCSLDHTSFNHAIVTMTGFQVRNNGDFVKLKIEYTETFSTPERHIFSNLNKVVVLNVYL